MAQSKMPGVRVAVGGGVMWKSLSQEEASSFFEGRTCSSAARASAGGFGMGCGRKSCRTVKAAARKGGLLVQRALQEQLGGLSCWPQQTSVKTRLKGKAQVKVAPEDKFLKRYGGRLLGGAGTPTASPTRGDDSAREPNADRDQQTAKSFEAQEQLAWRASIFEGIIDGGQYLPVFYMLKDTFDLSPVRISLTMGLCLLPWALKPCFAFVTDRLQICGRRRTPYMALSTLLIAGTYGGLALVDSYGAMVALLSLNTLGRCLMSATLQGMVVEIARPQGEEQVTRVVADFFMYKTTGALGSALISSFLVANLGPRLTFQGAMALPMVLLWSIGRCEAAGGEVTLAANRSPAASASPSNQLALDQWSALKEALQNPVVWAPLIYLLVFNAGPSYDDSLYYFYIDRLGFQPGVVGELKVAQELAKLIGIVAYRYYLRDIPEQKLMVGLTSLTFPLLLTPLLLTTGAYESLGVSPQCLAVSGELIREVFLHLQVLPAFSRWVKLCPEGLESSIVSLLVGTMQVSRAISKVSSAGAAAMLGVSSHNFDNLSLLIVICSCFCLLPLPVAAFIPPSEGERSLVPIEVFVPRLAEESPEGEAEDGPQRRQEAELINPAG